MLNVKKLKNYLLDKFKVCILDDVDGPVTVNVINGEHAHLQVTSYVVPRQYGDESEIDYLSRIGKDLMVANPDMTHFAFYELRDDLDSGVRLRYAALPYVEPKPFWEQRV